ncbi:MAG: DeoR/GlpR transcriptional regulator [Clostridia bacterium]|nr:DeoR/GlpR transcriptional regulator [Clostridia bacterium]MBR4979593.1 DeoR/GlpR transcriptional regulator [Clostridia bacterium]
MNLIRQDKIKEYLEGKSVATIKEVHELFPEVSLMTIHRDLSALEEQGVLTKHHGMVKYLRYKDDVDFQVRMEENTPGKMSMVKKAVTLIQPYTSVFFDAGTSNLLLAKNLPDINLNVITTSPGIALELCRLHNPTVTVCCGAMNRRNMAVSGQNTIEMLEKINIDVAFVGVSGYTENTGFTCGTEADMLIKKLVINKARVKVMMCSAEKLERLMPYTFADISDADFIVTDGAMPEEFISAAKEAGVTVL